MKQALKDTPPWVFALIIGISLIEPLTHLWVAYFPPGGVAFSGMHISDSVIFLHSMRMFETEFLAPYVTCAAADGGQGYQYFPVPFMWMYGAVGFVGSLLRIPEFLMLGLANALGAALYLTAVYAFFRTVLPRVSHLAFLLFALGGGIGGAAYVVSLVFGWTDAPGFQENFFRLALYELLEGARMAPWLASPRLYYSLPLACAYAGFTLLYRSTKTRRSGLIALSAILFLLGAGLNMRLGPFMLVIAGMLLYLDGRAPGAYRAKVALLLFVSAGAALGLGFWMLSWNEVYADNAFSLIRRGMWPSAFLTAACFQLAVTPIAIRRGMRALPMLGSIAAYGAVGYFVAYAILYVGYQVYYGSYWPPADYSASVKISDPALLGALIGAARGYDRAKHLMSEFETEPEILTRQWMTLWFLVFVAGAISAFGQGWYLGLGPQRLMLFMGPPLSLLAALSLSRIELRRPEFMRGWTIMTCSFGTVSMLVAVLCFQGPLGFTPGVSAFSEYHGEVIAEADGVLLESLGEGVVLAPTSMPLFGDVVTLRGNRALHGLGAWDLSNLPAAEISEIVDTFFHVDSDEDTRLEIVETYCVAWVYCPDTTAVSEEVIAQFRDTDWLEEVAAEGRGVVFKVAILPAASDAP